MKKRAIWLLILMTTGVYAEDIPWERYSVYEWRATRAQFGVGMSSFKVESNTDAAPAISLRYRLFPRPTRLNPWLEAGSALPHTPRTLRRTTEVPNSAITDQAEVRQNWQGHLAIGSEIPIGKQRILIPEAAVGAAVASLTTRFDSRAWTTFTDQNFTYTYQVPSFGKENSVAISPYFYFGFSLFPDRVISFRFSAAHVKFTHNPSHAFNYDFAPAHAHTQKFDLSLSGWQFMPMLQIKLLWPSQVHIPLTPQALPPWLLSAYTTEPVSPWVAPSGKDVIGNVMFQYQNRWAERVELMGDFNDWTPERMIKDRGGIWVAVKDLPPGKFHYVYRVNGKKEITDPWNKDVDPDVRDRGSSVVIVK